MPKRPRFANLADLDEDELHDLIDLPGFGEGERDAAVSSAAQG